MADFSIDQHVAELDARYRFPAHDNLTSKLTPEEKKAALFDALQDINAFPPQTFFLMEQVSPVAADPRWARLLYLGAAVNCYKTLIADTTANGFTLQVDEFNVDSRLDEYKNLHDTLKTDFEEKLEKLKTTSQKFIKGTSAGPRPNILNRGPALSFNSGAATRFRR